MDWTAAAAVANLVSAVAVVASLVYLALQVRHSTRVARAAAQDSVVAAARAVTLQLGQDPELDAIFRAGLQDLGGLSVDQRARFIHLAFQLLKIFESMHYQYRVGVLDEDTWRGWERMVHHYVAAPGLRAYYELRRDAFPRRFQDLIDAIPRTEASLTVEDLARKVTAAPEVG